MFFQLTFLKIGVNPGYKQTFFGFLPVKTEIVRRKILKDFCNEKNFCIGVKNGKRGKRTEKNPDL